MYRKEEKCYLTIGNFFISIRKIAKLKYPTNY